MKKLTAVLLSLVLLVFMASAALAVPFTLEAAGVTIDVPEGMTGVDMSGEHGNMLGISVDGNETLGYVCYLQYFEALAGTNLEDLTEEMGEQLLAGITAAIAEPVIDTVEGDGYTLLVIASGDGTQLHYVALVNGWLCDVAVVRVDGVPLTEEEIVVAAELLMSIEFAGDEAGAGAA